ncbi:anti-sigma factor family protein [Acidihalobacter prosperus]|uniref:Putative zinc-finger domain-containing protein n=1 Tax=Acidihalobacter prosperus TaxID=160660 RepID=A0A1A6C6K5_9GAMM|nr:zf-HC2 domain-containing protein [Acidihalobacter prosperus]OBS10193.1 hypothetical protein Thpro_021243 [Acidihalobacter prosperus]
MNCPVYRRRFDRYLDGTISADDRRELDEHLAYCPACREQLSWERRVWSDLRKLSVPPMRAGFADRAIARAVRQPSVRKPIRQRMVGLAVAASLLAGIAIGIGVQRQAQEGGAPTVQLAQGKDTIRLVFNASKPVQGVRFTVILPAGVEVAGHPGQREIVWHGQLKQGRNLLSLPLVAERSGRGVLRAEVQYGEYAREIQVGVHVKGNRTMSNI